nr:MAG TPA: Guanylate kinase [Caudoviricetes sp.]
MKQKIITIIGKSGAGKDTVARMLSYVTGYEVLCSYTTRPMREGEVEGREHHFVKECHTPKEKMLAYTEYGGYKYWTEVGQIKGTAIYVIDEKGLVALSEAFPDIDLVNIYVAAKPETLKARGIDPNRTERDEHRVRLDIDVFDYVVFNNGTEYDLFCTVTSIGRKLLNRDGIQLSEEEVRKALSKLIVASLKLL